MNMTIEIGSQVFLKQDDGPWNLWDSEVAKGEN